MLHQLLISFLSSPLLEISGSDNQRTRLSPRGSHGHPFQMQTTDKHGFRPLETTHITHYKAPFVLVLLILRLTDTMI